ncbi:MAG TPA: DUF6807 family protein [Phycisphaerae bacterium]|nr:DUF6807 family protein [Phycisphaerae bacterium]
MAFLLYALPGCRTGAPASLAEVHGVVPADWPAGIAGPLAVPIPADLAAHKTLSAEVEIAREPKARAITLQAQPFAGPSGGAQAWMIFTPVADDAGRPVTIRFKTAPPPERSTMSAGIEGPEVKLANDSQPILTYWHGVRSYQSPKAAKPWPLTDFIHPIIGLDGETLTDFAPADHRHHRGIFWAWVRHEQAGRKVGDWWIPNNMECDPGDVSGLSGPVFAGFEASHLLKGISSDNKTLEPFLRTDVRCRAFPITSDVRAIDIDLSLSAAADDVRIGGTLTLDKGYGGMTVRCAPMKDIRIEADGEVLDKDGVQYRARWADFSGIVVGPDGKPLPRRSGIAAMAHPKHPEYPPAWLLRFYGVISVSWPGLEMVDIPRDKPIHLYYRLIVHRGDAGEADIESRYRIYAADWRWRIAGAAGP